MFKIFRKNCCGVDVHKTLIYACICITDESSLTFYKEGRFLRSSEDSGSLPIGLAHIPAQICA